MAEKAPGGPQEALLLFLAPDITKMVQCPRPVAVGRHSKPVATFF
jgi:hypothetical protein